MRSPPSDGKAAPILIKGVKNVVRFSRRLVGAVSVAHDLMRKLQGSITLRVQCCWETDHRAVVLCLNVNGMQYNTFCARRNKQFCLALRGIDIVACTEEVLDKLRSQSFAVVLACRFEHNSWTTQTSSTEPILVEKGESVKRLLNPKRLFGINNRTVRQPLDQKSQSLPLSYL